MLVQQILGMYRSTLTLLFALALGCGDGSVHSEAPAPDGGVTIEIPDRPAGGEIHGFTFQHQVALIEDGILTLRQGEERFPELQVKILLFADKGEVPSERVYEADARSGPGRQSPHVHLGWKDPPSAEMPKFAILLHDDYVLRLELGEIREKKLPGKIFLSALGEHPTRVAGTFDAEVKGLILIDGQADLTSDAVGTVQWIAEQYVRQSHPDGQIEIVDFGESGLIGPYPDRPEALQHGWCDVLFRVDGGPETAWRLQLAKGDGGWAVHQRFDTGTILAAHPVNEPRLDDAYQRMRLQVARHIEAELDGRRAVYRFETRSCTNDKVQGRCRVRYRLDDPRGEEVERTFLFNRAGSEWEYVRER